MASFKGSTGAKQFEDPLQFGKILAAFPLTLNVTELGIRPSTRGRGGRFFGGGAALALGEVLGFRLATLNHQNL